MAGSGLKTTAQGWVCARARAARVSCAPVWAGLDDARLASAGALNDLESQALVRAVAAAPSSKERAAREERAEQARQHPNFLVPSVGTR